MKIQVLHDIRQKQDKNRNCITGKSFKAGDLLPIDKKNIHSLVSNSWQIDYFDSATDSIYVFEFNDEISMIFVDECEFDEVREIDNIKTIINLGKIAKFLDHNQRRFILLRDLPDFQNFVIDQ